MHEFWVTTIPFGMDDVDSQMRNLNNHSEDNDGWEFVAVDPQGHYIYRRPKDLPATAVDELEIPKPTTDVLIYDIDFDDSNPNYTSEQNTNLMFLKSIQNYMNNRIQLEGYAFLNDVLQALDIPRIPNGQLVGWISGPISFNINFGVVPFDERSKTVTLHLETEGVIYDQI